MILLPLAAVKKGTEMIGSQQKGEAEACQGKHYQNPGVKVDPGYITNNPQGKKQDVDGTGTVQHGKNKQRLGYRRLLPPKFHKAYPVGLRHINMILLPLVAVKKGTEMIGSQQKRETEAYQGKYYQYPGVKVGPGYITNNPQGKEQDANRTGTIQHGQN
jgi:hypothetical protein